MTWPSLMNDVTVDLSPLVPDLLAGSLARNSSRLGAPFSEPFTVVLMHTDVVGFTSFTEGLERDHTRGAEVLKRELSQHFSSILTGVADFGGQMLSFAGDATLAFWIIESAEETQEVLQRAVSCGLTIQERVQSDQGLEQRLVIGLGQIDFSHIGGVHDKWQFIASGAVWTQIKATDPLAPAGCVVLTDEARAACDERFSIAPLDLGAVVTDCVWPDSSQRATRPEIDSQSISRYVSGNTILQLTASHRDWIAEFRRATVLFLRVDSFDNTRALDLDLVNRVAAACQIGVFDSEGNIVQFMVDDKGLVLLASWGLALASHEDDAARAVMAAGQIHSTLEALGVRASAGIVTGKVFAGLVGDDDFLAYTMVGDAVNSAARLMQAADGSILCDEETAGLAAQRLGFEPAGEVDAKGKREAIAVFRPGSRIGLQFTDANTLVGRAAECAIVDAFLGSENIGPRRLMIEGEPGIGKSALGGYIRSQALSRGFRFLVGNTDSILRADRYLCFQPVFAELVQDTSSVAALQAQFESLDDLTVKAPLLNPVLGASFPETAFTDDLDAQGRAELTHDLLARMLEQSIQPDRALLLLNDVHWMDSSSWLLLDALVRRLPALRVVLLTRPFAVERLPIAARTLLDDRSWRRIELGLLSREDSVQLIANQLDTDHVSNELVRIIFERTEGHPLFTEELTYSLVQQNLIAFIDRSATLAHVDGQSQVSFPDRIESVIASRIDALTPAEQLTLRVASAFGREFSIVGVTLVRPVSLPEGEVRDQLRAIEQTRLIESAPGAGSLRFRHAVIQDTAHGLLTTEQQRELHRSVAEWLGAGADETQATPSVMAYHWGLAGEDLKAIDFLEQAARLGLMSNANAEVVSHLREAVERNARLGNAVTRRRAAEWEVMLGTAEARLGQFVSAQHHLQQALAGLHRKVPSSSVVAAVALLVELGVHIAYRKFGIARRVRDVESALTAADCYATLSRLYYNNHELLRTLLTTMAGANLAIRTREDSEVMARLYANLAVAGLSAPGDFSAFYAEEALAIAGRLQEQAGVSQILTIVGAYKNSIANWPDAEAHFTRAMRFADISGERDFYEMAAASLASLHRIRGDLDRALEEHRHVLQCGVDRSVPQVQIWGYYGIACCLSNLNRFSELDEMLVPFGEMLGDERARAEVSASNVIAYQMTKATRHLQKDEDEAALSLVKEGLDLLGSLPNLQFHMACIVSYTQDALMALWRRRPDDPKLPGMFEQMAAFEARCGHIFPMTGARVLFGAGNRELAFGDPAGAQVSWQQAAEKARELDIPFDEAQVLSSLLETELPEPEASACRERFSTLLDALAIEPPAAWHL